MLTVNYPRLPTLENVHGGQTQITHSQLSVSDVYQNTQQQSGHPAVTVYNLGFKGIWKLITQNDGESSVTKIGQFVDWLRGVKPSQPESQEHGMKQKRGFKFPLVAAPKPDERFDIDKHGRFCQMHQYLSRDYQNSKVNYNILCSIRYFTETELTTAEDEKIRDLSCSCFSNLCAREDEIFEIMNTDGKATNITTFTKHLSDKFPIEIRYTHLDGAFSDFALEVLQYDREFSKLNYCKDQEYRMSIALLVMGGGLIALFGIGCIGSVITRRCAKQKQLEKSFEAV